MPEDDTTWNAESKHGNMSRWAAGPLLAHKFTRDTLTANTKDKYDLKRHPLDPGVQILIMVVFNDTHNRTTGIWYIL